MPRDEKQLSQIKLAGRRRSQPVANVEAKIRKMIYTTNAVASGAGALRYWLKIAKSSNKAVVACCLSFGMDRRPSRRRRCHVGQIRKGLRRGYGIHWCVLRGA
jgi:hypothetical protein